MSAQDIIWIILAVCIGIGLIPIVGPLILGAVVLVGVVVASLFIGALMAVSRLIEWLWIKFPEIKE